MATRRRRGEDGISFEHRGPCRDPRRHRNCPGLWRGEITLGYTGDGKRTRRKVSAQTKAAVIDKLRDLHTQLDKGITPKAGYVHYTVRQAAHDWLATGLDGRSPKTITKNQNVLEPILTVIGARKLRELTAADVRRALATMATGYSSAAPRWLVNTSPVSCQPSPAASRSPAWLSAQARSAWTATAGRPRVRRDRSVLVSPWVRTDRHTATCGGTGGRAAGSPSRSTWAQRSARASSVRIPVSRLSVM